MKLSTLMGGAADDGALAAQIEISGLTADSREVAPGYLFAALSGTRTDGVRFIPQAVRNGAAGILVARDADFDEPPGIPVWREANPRRALSLAAARFHGRQPGFVAAITGTNGKTSVAAFLQQIWEAHGVRAASLGTLGIVSREATAARALTTPDPVALHRDLDRLARSGITHLALEASSHGLAQFRLDGVRIAAGAFTNISRDHLDYHPSFEDYFAQKMRLFCELLEPGCPAVIDVDGRHGREVEKLARARKLNIFSVGRDAVRLRLVDMRRRGFGQDLTVEIAGETFDMALPLTGAFQSSNVLVAAGLAIAGGLAPQTVAAALATLKGAAGRLERVATSKTGASIFVDYAHTPDALENALGALRPCTENRLIVVMGCGGERDRGKRPQMGAVSARLADRVIVTDDNPRGEDPAAIRKAILAAVPQGEEIGDRAAAIEAAMNDLQGGDVLLVAGKGHETGQVIGDEVIAFSDHDVIRDVLGTGGAR